MDTTCVKGHRGTQLTNRSHECLFRPSRAQARGEGDWQWALRKQPSGRAQGEPSRIATPVCEGESTVWSNQRVVRQGAQNSVPSPKNQKGTHWEEDRRIRNNTGTPPPGDPNFAVASSPHCYGYPTRGLAGQWTTRHLGWARTDHHGEWV